MAVLQWRESQIRVGWDTHRQQTMKQSFLLSQRKGGRALAVLLLWLTEYFCYPSSLPRTQHHTFGTHLAIAAFGWTSIPPLILNHP
ncbi:hypothetical protein IAS59_000322 [Cryptococcus gattii]